MSNAFEQGWLVGNGSSSLTSRVEEVTIDQVFQDAFVCLAEVPGAVVARSGLVFIRQHSTELDAFRVAAFRKRSVLVVDISNTSRHTSAEVSADIA